MSAPSHAPPARDTAERGRVAVAMSGGVDSSVAAALLVAQGHEVVGVHMKLNDLPDSEKRDKSCCSLDDALDARQVCGKLGIPYYVIDLVEEFRSGVIDYFVSAYRAGRTPNPCVMCNRTVKSAVLLERVRAFGCDTLATGHYARLTRDGTGRHLLRRARDRSKDQTYFLFATPAAELPHLLYPLEALEKTETRQVAARHGFITWNKPDSQEVCFVPGDYRDFLRPLLSADPPPPGPFVDTAGRELGRHEGLPYYTIGQRRGLGLSAARPLYVVDIRTDRNEVVLGHEEELLGTSLVAEQVNWVSCEAPAQPLEATVQVRYAHAGTPARLEPLGEGRVRVDFAQPVRAITPGQAAVFYADDVLLGGGWIEGRR